MGITVSESEKILFYFRIVELATIVLLVVSHTKTEFVVPSCDYGAYWEVAVNMTVFSAMLIPAVLRLQASIMGPGLEKCFELTLLAFGIIFYILAAAVTIQCWIRTQKIKHVFFRKLFTEFLLGKGIVSLILAALFCIDAYFVISKGLFE